MFDDASDKESEAFNSSPPNQLPPPTELDHVEGALRAAAVREFNKHDSHRGRKSRISASAFDILIRTCINEAIRRRQWPSHVIKKPKVSLMPKTLRSISTRLSFTALLNLRPPARTSLSMLPKAVSITTIHFRELSTLESNILKHTNSDTCSCLISIHTLIPPIEVQPSDMRMRETAKLSPASPKTIFMRKYRFCSPFNLRPCATLLEQFTED